MNKLDKLRIRKSMVDGYTNPVQFISGFMYFRHYERDHTLYSPTNKQEKFIEAMADGNVIVDATRASGVTLTSSLFLLWYAIANPNSNIAIMSNNSDASCYGLEFIRYAHFFLPEHMMDMIPQITKNIRNEIRFSNGSRIVALAANPEIFRGTSYKIIHLDNFGLHSNRKQDEIIQCYMPSLLSNRGSVVITNTAEADVASPYRSILHEAEQYRNNFTAIKLY